MADRVLRVPLRSLASSQRFGELMGVVSVALLLPFLFFGGGVGSSVPRLLRDTVFARVSSCSVFFRSTDHPSGGTAGPALISSGASSIPSAVANLKIRSSR